MIVFDTDCRLLIYLIFSKFKAANLSWIRLQCCKFFCVLAKLINGCIAANFRVDDGCLDASDIAFSCP